MNTPYFVLDKSILDGQIDLLKKAIDDYWPNTIVGYSYKTNSLPWLIKYMKDQGFYAEVVSDDEYRLATNYVKNPIDNIIYNGIAKSKITFIEAVKNEAIVNIDSEQEIAWLKEASSCGAMLSIGIRVNFDIESFCPGESACGSEGGRFGFCFENGEFFRILSEVNAIPNVRLAGLHLHCSSRTRSLNIYRAIAKMACEIIGRYQLHLDYIDVGGGYFGGMENRPSFPDYLKTISSVFSASDVCVEDVKLIIEPGMSLVGPAFDYICSVVDVKNTIYNRFVVTDGSRIHLDPLMTKQTYFYDVLYFDKEQRKELQKQVVSGFTCMEHDRLFNLLESREIRVGDQFVFHKVGAYTMCLSPLFIKYYPDVYLHDGTKNIVIRTHWSESEYVQNSVGH